MDQYVGLDVSQKLTAICVIDQDGKQLWRGSCATSPASIAAVLQQRAPRLNKTDTNDAHGIAQLTRTGWYRPVEIKSMASHALALSYQQAKE